MIENWTGVSTQARIGWILVALLVGGCAPGARPVTGTTATPAVAQSVSSATIELPPHPTRLRGAGTAWRQAVANVYGPACGGDRSLVPPELAQWPVAEACPLDGSGTSAMMVGTTVAVAGLGDDVIYGFDQGFGFQIVAARVPSLGGTFYGPLPKTVAIVGSDARPGQDVPSSRADSIHIVGLDGNGRGAIVGIPRDSWVDYANGRRGKINGSLSSGGPDVFLQTLANVTGLNFDGYLLTGFEGFQELWGNVLGGANVDLPTAMVDRAAGANFGAGFQYFNGPQAISFARARKTLNGGDLQRSLNGGVLLQVALATTRHLGPLALPAMMQAGWPWFVTDLTAGEILAVAALAIDTPELENAVAPGRIGTAGPASVVYLTPAAPDLFGDLADGSLEP